jgi:hypothetical protein
MPDTPAPQSIAEAYARVTRPMSAEERAAVRAAASSSPPPRPPPAPTMRPATTLDEISTFVNALYKSPPREPVMITIDAWIVPTDILIQLQGLLTKRAPEQAEAIRKHLLDREPRPFLVHGR